MKEINLGHILIENRHKRGITQDELASYIGVSKAAVSKWETGTTYPDITLLPQLATYFNISIVILLMAIYFVFSLYTSGELKNTDIMEAIRE